MILELVGGLVAGFILGILVGRKNPQKVEKAVAEVKELIQKAEAKGESIIKL